MASDLTYLAGEEIQRFKPLPPFADIVCSFLDDYSKELLHDHACKKYPDIMAVAFWARKGNIFSWRERLNLKEMRIGRGLAFHITPSNIPVQFIFSYMFGLLAGNANIVRVTSVDYPQISLLCNVLEQVLHRDEYETIRTRTSIVRYPRESDMTREFSKNCHIRIIWGGDSTIAKIREYPISPRAIEMVFADRYSITILSAEAVNKADDMELQRLVHNFYNDTFLMDQNACSSPQLLFWQGEEEDIVLAKQRFWSFLEPLVKERYDLPPIKVTSKYLDFCANAIRFRQTGELCCQDNYIYRVTLSSIPANCDELRGRFGLFYEYDLKSPSELSDIINAKYQTLTYYGVEAEKIGNMVIENQWLGIDRIVPVGKALDMDLIWDGYDFIREMSRIVDVR